MKQHHLNAITITVDRHDHGELLVKLNNDKELTLGKLAKMLGSKAPVHLSSWEREVSRGGATLVDIELIA